MNKDNHFCADCGKRSQQYIFCEECEAKYIERPPKVNYKVLHKEDNKV